MYVWQYDLYIMYTIRWLHTMPISSTSRSIWPEPMVYLHSNFSLAFQAVLYFPGKVTPHPPIHPSKQWHFFLDFCHSKPCLGLSVYKSLKILSQLIENVFNGTVYTFYTKGIHTTLRLINSAPCNVEFITSINFYPTSKLYWNLCTHFSDNQVW